MNVRDFFEAINVELEVTEIAKGSYRAQGRYCEIKDDCVLIGESGRGATSKQALADYATRISGKRLVVDAMSPNRREFNVPVLGPKPKTTKDK